MRPPTAGVWWGAFVNQKDEVCVINESRLPPRHQRAGKQGENARRHAASQTLPALIALFLLTHVSKKRGEVGLTDGHHVVPAVQQAHAELQPVGRVAHVDQSQLPVRVLADGGSPGHQEPADDEQDDAQQPQHSPAGHVGDPLRRAGQEHLQHPAGRRQREGEGRGVRTKQSSLQMSPRPSGLLNFEPVIPHRGVNPKMPNEQIEYLYEKHHRLSAFLQL